MRVRASIISSLSINSARFIPKHVTLCLFLNHAKTNKRCTKEKKKLRILPAFSWKNRMVGPASEKKMACKHTTVFQVLGKSKHRKLEGATIEFPA
jgi:hypothetical protein